MIHPVYDAALCAAISASLDLRAPNAEALTTIAVLAADRLATDDAPPFEGVIDVATGVGKTYVLAAAIDYFAAIGYRHFAIITPGRTVTRKTIANFSPDHPKSLLGGMGTAPFLVTAGTFDSPAVDTAMDDETIAKLYIFTVQALLTPTSKADRRTHEFQEDLGAALYARLAATADLVVFADESHLYGGKKFEAAVRGLAPRMLLGLTATPPRGAQVIYRYPLPAAIAEGYVKTPVIVGRPDDRNDFFTKLTDGVRLLEGKRQAIDIHRAEHPGAPVVNPVMLVLAPDTEAADECVGILRHPKFADGAYADAILPIHSNVTDPDKALAALDAVEDPHSPVRVIVSVGMLKEGWDVKNVYVICSLRASVSEILTEQTLGRGLRLPYGALTGNEMLDTLEVVAHERYDTLINRIDKLREEFIDYRTAVAADGAPGTKEVATAVAPATAGAATIGTATIAGIDDRLAHQDEVLADTAGPELRVRADLPVLMLPVVTSTTVASPFSLSEITDLEPFRTEGRRIAANPEDRLRRTVIEGKITTDASTGARTAGLRRRKASDEVLSAGGAVPVATSIKRLTDDVMDSGAVPNRRGQRELLDRIIAVFLDGLGPQAPAALAAYERRTADGITGLIRAFQAGRVPTTTFSDEVELRPFAAVRHSRKTVLPLGSPFSRGVGYTGFARSLYTQDWFDGGSTEFALAELLDDTADIALWLRLQRDDLPLAWAGDTKAYNPDFVALDTAGVHWVIEGKADDTAADPAVLAKQKAAINWAAHVSATTGVQWRYMFATESDIATAKGSWSALKRLSLAE